MSAAAESFEELRPLLFSLAYRMLGSVSEAEDVVQDGFVRYQRAQADGASIDSAKAYLSAVITRLSIDHLRSARAQREAYVGQWLPEPLVGEAEGDDPAEMAQRSDELSMAFLLLLERLSPLERAVLLLHDVFGYEFAEIAEIVNRSSESCRQLAVRARRHIAQGKPRFKASVRDRDALAERFFAAVRDGEVEALRQMLAADVMVQGDGGGKAPQWSRPIVGPDRVAKLMAGVGRQIADIDGYLERRRVNGQPGAIVRTAEGLVVSVFSVEIAEGQIQAVRAVINPDKLRHLGEIADVWSMVRERARRKPDQS
jgi:RNA polymerase sigma-70 factor (ECF subfamily)